MVGRVYGYTLGMPQRTVTPVHVDGRRLELSNLGKLLVPGTNFTKGALIAYYADVAPVLLPHLQGRPITLKRFPDGIDGTAFYEKRCPGHRPPWLPTVAVRSERSGTIDYCSVRDAATLVWLANLGTIELHPSLARSPRLDQPTTVVFDLDPGPPAGVLEAATVAFSVRDALVATGLSPHVKVSGSKGVHVAARIDDTDFAATKAFARAVATTLESREPDRVVSSMRKDRRGGKVLIDWSQNDASKTTVAAYSLRARAGPTVSAPVTWAELEAAVAAEAPDRLRFGPDDVRRRIEQLGDLHAALLAAPGKGGP